MNALHPAQRSTAAVVVQSLFWLWLIGLSVIVALGYLAMRDQTDQERLDSRLQRLEAQATGLAVDRPEFHRHSVAALRVALFELYR